MSFANSFWSHDYHLGYEVLFDELMEGIKENDDFIQLFTRRMELERAYGIELQNPAKSTSKRHEDDDYVSTIKNAFSEMNMNFAKQGEKHVGIADNIRSMVLEPFLKWCVEHEQRVGYLELVVSDQYKQFKNAHTNLEKLQKKYFNKCRMLEEFKLHYSDKELEELAKESAENDQTGNLAENNDKDQEIYTFAGSQYDAKTAADLLADMLGHIELTSHKVPILGTYQNVSSGSAITQWILDNMPEFHGSIVKAESFGQDLVTHGFIRLIGSMSASKNFINSLQFMYQWKPIVFEMTKMSEFDLSRKNLYDTIAGQSSRNQFSNYLEDVKQAMGVTSVDYTDPTQYSRLVSEVDMLDTQYFQTTKELDRIRCEFEEIVMDHLTFMQKCELDRMKAVKKAMFDFLSAFSNKVSALKQACDELFVVEETINPANDLKFLVENYATGTFDPRVTLYDNYYDSNVRQTFGVDLNVKSRLDRRAVPLLVQTVLSYLDEVYPELKDDDERAGLWTQMVHLSKVHQLRFQLNELSDAEKIKETLAATEPLAVTNVLKLYLMELPDLVVPSSYYDLIRTLYQNYPVGKEDSDKSRINGLQNTLLELPVSNLATLDAILTHLTRLVHIVGSMNADLASTLKTRLCREFGNMVLRPKEAEKNGHSATELLQQHFMSDLFENKSSIFGELRKRNSLKQGSRPLRRGSEKRKESPELQKSAVETSKSRLETRLKRAVSKTDKTDLSGSVSPKITLRRSVSPKKKGKSREGTPSDIPNSENSAAGALDDSGTAQEPPAVPPKQDEVIVVD